LKKNKYLEDNSFVGLKELGEDFQVGCRTAEFTLVDSQLWMTQQMVC
jgi:hypothetical protein